MPVMLDDIKKYLRFIRWYKRDMVFEKVWTILLLGVVLFFPKRDTGYLFLVACCLLSYCTVQFNMNYKYGKKRYRFDFMKNYREVLLVYQALICIKDEEQLINFLYNIPCVKFDRLTTSDTCVYGQNLKDSYMFTIFCK